MPTRERLAAEGRNIVVATRRRDRARHLFLLPTVEVVEADIGNPVELARLCVGQDAVVNLIGILHGDSGMPYGKAFRAAHVDMPKKIVAACRASGVARLLHMSALGAGSNAASMYLRSKADGEAAVLADSAIATTVFRPSVIFGAEDHFLNLFATLQKWFFVMPLARADARFQPVYVEDVANAFAHALDNPETYGKTYELAGPRVYTLRELVALAGESSGHTCPIIPLPDFLGRLQATLLGMMPGPKLMSRDNFDSMQNDNVATGPIAPELDLTLTPLEQMAPEYLAGQHPRTRYDRFRGSAHR